MQIVNDRRMCSDRMPRLIADHRVFHETRLRSASSVHVRIDYCRRRPSPLLACGRRHTATSSLAAMVQLSLSWR